MCKTVDNILKKEALLKLYGFRHIVTSTPSMGATKRASALKLHSCVLFL